MEVDINDRTGLDEDEYYVETVENKKIVGTEVHYHVKWIGYDASENTDECIDHLINSLETVKNFEKAQLEKLRRENGQFDLNNLDRGKPVKERWDAHVLLVKREVLEDIVNGEATILRVFGCAVYRLKKYYFVEVDGIKKVFTLSEDEIAKLPVTEQRKFEECAREIRDRVLLQQKRQSIGNRNSASASPDEDAIEISE